MGTESVPCYCHGDDFVPYCPRHTEMLDSNQQPSGSLEPKAQGQPDATAGKDKEECQET